MGFFGDLWDGVCEIASGICETFKSVASEIAEIAKNTISSVFNLIASKAETLLISLGTLVLGPVWGPIVGEFAFRVIKTGIESLAKKSKIIEENDTAENVGYRMEEADQHSDWKRPEDFSSFKEYYEYLKAEIPDDTIDKEKLEKNKTRYTAIGITSLTKGIEEENDIEISESFLFEIGKSRMEADEITAIIETFKTLGYDSVAVSEYFKSELEPKECREITDMLVSAMKKYYPMKDEDVIYERIDDMRNASRDDKYVEKMYRNEIEQVKKDGKLQGNL